MPLEVLLTPSAQTLIVEKPTMQVLEVARQGPPGPPGPAGSAGGSTAFYVQALASAVWTCPHNLGRFPSVTVTDTLGNVITPDISYIDNNIVRITHGLAMAGTAYFN